MTKQIEIFSAGCSLCEDTIQLVHKVAAPGSQITVLDMQDPKNVQRAKQLKIGRVPAVVVDGKLTDPVNALGEDSIRKALQ